MLSRFLVLSLLVTLPSSVFAQTVATPDANTDTELAPLPPAADPGPATVAPESSDSALDEPITRIAGTTGGCAVLDKDFPGLRAHPMYPFFKSMTLNQIAAMSHGQITPEMLAQARSDLAGVATSPTAAVPVATVAPPPAAPAALVH